MVERDWDVGEVLRGVQGAVTPAAVFKDVDTQRWGLTAREGFDKCSQRHDRNERIRSFWREPDQCVAASFGEHVVPFCEGISLYF